MEEVLASGQIAQGEKTEEFEKNFAAFAIRRFAVAVSSGSSALHLSLLALGVSPGDEILFPSFTCVALLHAVAAVRARPVLSDIDGEDFNLSVRELKKKISRKTRAILVPHAFGRAAGIKDILGLGVPVLEDGTQALGASRGGKKVGSFGALSLFSFYATKMMTTGEGGIVLTDSAKFAERVRDLRDYDKKKDYRWRTNSKMTDLEAAMGLAQLRKLPSFIEARRKVAAFYQTALADLKLGLPPQERGGDHVYFRYVLRVPRNAGPLIRELNAKKIEAKAPLFRPVHRYLGLRDSDFPETSRAMKEACSLPIYPLLDSESAAEVSAAVRSFVGGRSVPRTSYAAASP